MTDPLQPMPGIPLAQTMVSGSLQEIEKGFRSGKLTADFAVMSLAEMDAYYLKVRQADGKEITGVFYRPRANPRVGFIVGNFGDRVLIPVGEKMMEVLSQRLPPPPAPTQRNPSEKLAKKRFAAEPSTSPVPEKRLPRNVSKYVGTPPGGDVPLPNKQYTSRGEPLLPPVAERTAAKRSVPLKDAVPSFDDGVPEG